MIKTFTSRTACPACKSNNFKTVYSCPYSKDPIKTLVFQRHGYKNIMESLENVNYTVVTCCNCTLVYQLEIPTKVFSELFYKETFNPDAIGGKGYNYTLNQYACIGSEIVMLISYFNKIPQELDFYDFGMGWGKWCSMALGFGCNVFGTEFSDLRINFTQKRGITNIPFEEIGKIKFDFINTDMVFEHLADPLQILTLLKTALKPNGVLKINVPNGTKILSKLENPDWFAPPDSKKSLLDITPIEHLNSFNRRSLLELGKNAGLKEFSFPFNFQFSFVQVPKLKWLLINLLRPIYRKFYKKASWGNSCIFFKPA